MKIRTRVLALILLVPCFSAFASFENQFDEKVTTLNIQSIKLLGVSLNSLRYLMAATPYSYIHLGFLNGSGDINYVRELESKGYVSLRVQFGRLDGSEKNQEFMVIEPTADGLELQRCFIGLPHNISLQPTR